MIIRIGQISDIEAIVELSRAKRLAYEKAQPKFWKYAGIDGDNVQKEWFKELLRMENYLMFTAIHKNTGSPDLHSLLRDDEEILGFIIGKLIESPEVYNPCGLTLMIDDFCVKTENLWQSVGAKLIEEIKLIALKKGASQILVVCGAHDHLKRGFLISQKLNIASEWFVGGIV